MTESEKQTLLDELDRVATIDRQRGEDRHTLFAAVLHVLLRRHPTDDEDKT